MNTDAPSGPRPARWLETRTSLVRRLGDPGDHQAWCDFVDAYGRVLHALALRSGLSREDAEDLVQDTFASIAGRIAEFRYDPSRGTFKGWIFAMARSRIIDRLRKRRRDPLPGSDPASVDDTSRTPWLERLPDPASPDWEAIAEDAWRRGLYEAALDRVRRDVSPRQFQIFDLHVRHEWDVARVAGTLGVTPNQVYLAKSRIADALAAEVTRLEAGPDVFPKDPDAGPGG